MMNRYYVKVGEVWLIGLLITDGELLTRTSSVRKADLMSEDKAKLVAKLVGGSAWRSNDDHMGPEHNWTELP
jgi:hypothetical protein